MARDENYTPFTRRIAQLPVPMRVLHRFTKAGGHVAEIRERTVTKFKALEWLVFVDGSLTESQMLHGARLDRYQPELEIRIAQFLDGGWIEDQAQTAASTSRMGRGLLLGSWLRRAGHAGCGALYN